MTPKLSNLKIVWGYWKNSDDSCFRFNNPKQCSNWIIFVSCCSSHLAIKIVTMFILWKFKNWCKNRIFRKNFKKVCVLQRWACSKFKRNYLENYNDSEHAVKTKNAPLFMIFPNISFFHMIVTYWTCPLSVPLKFSSF